MMLKMQEARDLDVLVMLGMLTGHGDVENDAHDVDGLAYISRENAENYSILVARTENKIQNKTTNHPKLSLDPYSFQGTLCAESWLALSMDITTMSNFSATFQSSSFNPGCASSC